MWGAPWRSRDRSFVEQGCIEDLLTRGDDSVRGGADGTEDSVRPIGIPRTDRRMTEGLLAEITTDHGNDTTEYGVGEGDRDG